MVLEEIRKGERRVVTDGEVFSGERFEVVDLFLHPLKRETDFNIGFSRGDDTEGLAETDEQTGIHREILLLRRCRFI